MGTSPVIPLSSAVLHARSLVTAARDACATASLISRHSAEIMQACKALLADREPEQDRSR